MSFDVSAIVKRDLARRFQAWLIRKELMRLQDDSPTSGNCMECAHLRAGCCGNKETAHHGRRVRSSLVCWAFKRAYKVKGVG